MKNTTKRLLWKGDEEDCKYFVDKYMTISKIDYYNLTYKYDKVYIIYHHYMYSKMVKRHVAYQGDDLYENTYTSLEEFVRNHIFDTYYQAKKHLESITKPNPKAIVNGRWAIIDRKRVNLENGWEDGVFESYVSLPKTKRNLEENDW
jgi:hypothetical protein